MNQIDIAGKIVARRKALNVTQAQVADLAGVSRGTMTSLENPADERGVTLSTLLAVLGVLGLSIRIEP